MRFRLRTILPITLIAALACLFIMFLIRLDAPFQIPRPSEPGRGEGTLSDPLSESGNTIAAPLPESVSFPDVSRSDTETNVEPSVAESAIPSSSNAVSADASNESKSRSLDELLLFFPTRYPEGNWAPDELNFQDVLFDSDDGVQLHGWYCPNEHPRAIILIAHGNAGNVASRAAWLNIMQSRLRASVFMFDYRGYGRSQGEPSVEGALSDTRAARQKLCELAGVKESGMVLMGESLGGAFTVELAAESAPRALILQSTFSSLKDVADVHFPELSWLVAATKLNSASRIGMYHGPLLISHGDSDNTVPYVLGKTLFDAANDPKEFVTIPNADHNDWLTEDYLQRLDQFIENLTMPRT